MARNKSAKSDFSSKPDTASSSAIDGKNTKQQQGSEKTMADSNNNKASQRKQVKQNNGKRLADDKATNSGHGNNKTQKDGATLPVHGSTPPAKKPRNAQQTAVATDSKEQRNPATLKEASLATDKKAVAKKSTAAKGKKAVSFKKKTTIEAVSYVHPSQPGVVLVTGEGDTGQLGLGPDVMDRSKPARVTLPDNVIQICAGGMHSVCLTVKGEVYTFGCNDEGALGRKVADEDECMTPERVDVAEKVMSVSAGDSHTAALTHDGHVYVWGTFRDANGPIGIVPGHGKLESPTRIMKEVFVIKIASGSDHLVCLSNKGDIYTLGAAEQGQLGRVAEFFTARGGRRGLDLLLCPSVVKCRSRHVRFCDIWTGQYCTFAKAADSGDIYCWGLNNYYQLGIADMQNKFIPERARSFESSRNWAMISCGQHHTVALDGSGLVYALGRKEYGRLGLGEANLEEKSSPTVVPKLQKQKCVNVSCGTAVSFAVADNGTVYGWGMGSTKQLGQGDDEDDVYEPIVITGKQLQNKKCLMTSAGGQHTMLLARE